jgi:hypothetical protein
MESDWDPEKYQDTHRRQLEAIIEAKRQGDEIVTGTEVQPPSTNVVDLMQVLSASVDSVRAAGRSADEPTARTAKKTTATTKKAPASTTKKSTAPPAKKRAAPKRPTPIKATAKAAKPKAAARRKAS